MEEVLTETELTTRQLYDQGCEKYGMVPFMREVNGLLHEGVRVDEALRTAGAAIDRQRLEREVIERAIAFGKAWRARIQDRISTSYPSEQLDHEATEKRIKLCDAVDALDRFEPSQQQIKK